MIPGAEEARSGSFFSFRGRRTARRRSGAVDVVWALRPLRGLSRVDWSDDSDRDTEFIRILDRAFAGLYDRYFRVEVRGWEHVPGSPALLVGNHSGFGVAELLMLLVAWFRRYGETRPVYALAHRWLYRTPFLRIVIPKIGGVPATWRDACDGPQRRGPLANLPGRELGS